MDETVKIAITQAVKREPFAQALKMELTELEDGYSVVRMVNDPDKMNNIYDRAHGGALFGLIDEAFETAAQTGGTIAVALNVNITYVASPRPGVVLLAKVTDRDDSLIATCQALAYRTGKPIPFLETD